MPGRVRGLGIKGFGLAHGMPNLSPFLPVEMVGVTAGGDVRIHAQGRSGRSCPSALANSGEEAKFAGAFDIELVDAVGKREVHFGRRLGRHRKTRSGWRECPPSGRAAFRRR